MNTLDGNKTFKDIMTSDKIYEELKKIIDLPDGVIYLKLEIGSKMQPLLEIERYVEASEFDGTYNPTVIKEKFKLVQVDNG